MFNRKLIKTLKNTINSLQEDLENEKQKNSFLTKDLVVLQKTVQSTEIKLLI